MGEKKRVEEEGGRGKQEKGKGKGEKREDGTGETQIWGVGEGSN